MNLRVTFFFIATFFLLCGGIISVLPSIPKLNKELKSILQKGRFQIKMGLYGLVSMLIFALFPFDRVMLIGDLIPFIVCSAMTLLFMFGYIRISKHIDQKTLSRTEKIITILQIPVGFAGIIAGLLHILLPGILFL